MNEKTNTEKQIIPVEKLAEEWDRLDRYYSQLAEVAQGAGYDKGSFIGKSIGFSTCAAQLRAALAEKPASDEVVWLIERDGPQWMFVAFDRPEWSSDSLKALRFSRKQDAEQFLVMNAGLYQHFGLKVTEHKWMKVQTDFHSVNLSTGEKTRSIVGDGERKDEVVAAERPQLSAEQVRGALARGYCHAKNSHKVLDTDLLIAIEEELFALLTGEAEKVADLTGIPVDGEVPTPYTTSYSGISRAPAAPPVLQADDATLTVREHFRAVKHLQEHGYADWDGTANGMETTLTGCANAMREYAAAIRREAERAAFEKAAIAARNALATKDGTSGYAYTVMQAIRALADSPVSGDEKKA